MKIELKLIKYILLFSSSNTKTELNSSINSSQNNQEETDKTQVC